MNAYFAFSAASLALYGRMNLYLCTNNIQNTNKTFILLVHVNVQTRDFLRKKCRWREVFETRLFKNGVSHPLYFFRNQYSLDSLRPISNWGRYLYICQISFICYNIWQFSKTRFPRFFENISHTITKFEPIPYETQSAQDWVQRLLVRDRLSQPTPIAYTEMYGVWM